MSIVAAQLTAKVSTEGVEQTKRELSEVGHAAEETHRGFGDMLKGALSFAAGQAIFMGVGAAVGFLKDQIADTLRVTIDHQQIMAQTNQVLKSTHDVSGMTAQALDDLATAFSKTTQYSADTVQGGENLLLTFTNIGKSVFPQATQAILDVSTAMHQDLQTSAIQVGKALGDPLTGLTNLQRIGVTFSAQEKEQIKTMMAHNDIIGAQKIILHELATEFGGSATAAGKTFGGQLDILKNQMEDLKIKIGTALLPHLNDLLQMFTGKMLPAIEDFAGKAGHFLQPFGYLLQFIANEAKGAFKDIGDTLTQVGQIFKSVFGGLTGGGNPLGDFFNNLISFAYPAIDNLSKAFHGLMTDLQKNLSTINPQQILGFFKSIGDYVMPVFKQIGGTIGGQLKQDFQTFMSIAQSLASWWQSAMVPAIKQALPGFEALGNVIFTKVMPALAQLWADGHKIADALLPVIVKAFEEVVPVIVEVEGFIAGKLAPAIAFLTPYIMQAATQVVKFAQDISTRAMPIVKQLGEVLKEVADWLIANWPKIWDALAPAVMTAFNTIKGIIEVAWSLITGIFKIGMDFLSGNWSQMWNDFKDMLGGVWNGIEDILKGGIDVVIGFLNDFIGGLDSIGIDVGPIHIHPNISKIPLLASGTDFFGGGPAIVGDKGPELVNLPRGAQVVPNNLLGSYGGGGGNQQAVLQIDGYTLARVILPYLASNIRTAVGIVGM